MANLADCAIAIAKKDLDKLDGAITKSDDIVVGSETKWKFKIEKDKVIAEVVYYSKYTCDKDKNESNERYYKVNGEKMTQDEYDARYGYKNGWVHTGKQKTLIDKYYSEGWCVDWVKLHSYSYDYDTWVQEYSDHITVYFGGRWSFPEELNDYLNSKDIEWQGAVVEDGCEVYDDELGTTDFNLRIEEEENSDTDGYNYTTHYLQDQSTDIIRA